MMFFLVLNIFNHNHQIGFAVSEGSISTLPMKCVEDVFLYKCYPYFFHNCISGINRMQPIYTGTFRHIN